MIPLPINITKPPSLASNRVFQVLCVSTTSTSPRDCNQQNLLFLSDINSRTHGNIPASLDFVPPLVRSFWHSFCEAAEAVFRTCRPYDEVSRAEAGPIMHILTRARIRPKDITRCACLERSSLYVYM